MGYIIKAYRNQTNFELFGSSSPYCSVGLDKRGIPILAEGQRHRHLNLFDIRQRDSQNSILIASCSDLNVKAGPILKAESETEFSDFVSLAWRDITFEISYISSSAFLMAKLGRSDLLNAKAKFYLQCKEIFLSVPVFEGTLLRIGSHSLDSITISDPLVKTGHALLEYSDQSSEPTINAHLGQVEVKKTNEIIAFTLAPAKLEFQIGAIS